MMVMVKLHNTGLWVVYVQREALPAGYIIAKQRTVDYNYRTTFTQEQSVVITVLESA